MDKVFVFGTLKSGFPNHHINHGIKVEGEYQTLAPYPLHLVGERHSPWLMLEEGKGYCVSGEVYQVDEQGLAMMDKLERVEQPDGYQRVNIWVEDRVSGHREQIYVYGKEKQQLSMEDIRLTLDGEYTLSHAKLYRPRNTTKDTSQ